MFKKKKRKLKTVKSDCKIKNHRGVQIDDDMNVCTLSTIVRALIRGYLRHSVVDIRYHGI